MANIKLDDTTANRLAKAQRALEVPKAGELAGATAAADPKAAAAKEDQFGSRARTNKFAAEQEQRDRVQGQGKTATADYHLQVQKLTDFLKADPHKKV